MHCRKCGPSSRLRSTMAVTLQIHSAILRSASRLIAAEPRHTLFKWTVVWTKWGWGGNPPSRTCLRLGVGGGGGGGGGGCTTTFQSDPGSVNNRL